MVQFLVLRKGYMDEILGQVDEKNHENTEVETEHVSEQNSSASSDQTPYK